MPKNIKFIAIGVGCLVLAAVAYFVIVKPNTSDSAVVSTPGAKPTTQEQVTFQEMSRRLEPISFDTSIFSDPHFTSLVDIHIPVVPEPIGRTDPFATLP
jgi:hypothetical protein